MDNSMNRRGFLVKSVGMTTLALGSAAVLTACGKSGGGAAAAGCTDTTGLSEADKTMRTSNAYVDVAADAAKACDKCARFQAAAAGAACGGCSVIKGPIAPKGTCKLFAPKAA